MSPPSLIHLDFQLAYLILLTRQGLKPLSRWEGSLGEDGREIILSEGLAVETVVRRTRIGRRLHETVFARHPGYTALYKRHFDGTRLKDTPEAARLQGRLFGYPSCCVDAFIRRPYAPNDLAPQDQEILFHWACPSCVITPGLLREYRRVHTECRRLLESRVAILPHRTDGFARSLSRIAAAIALVAGTSLPAAAQDLHWLPAPDDIDQDYLAFAEEILSGTNWENADTDQNQVLDGVQISLLLSQLLDSPPSGVVLEHHALHGLEDCRICGATVNMGHVTIRHTYRGISVDLPYIALHYLEHGCLQYDGTIHSGRVDLDALKRILFPSDPAHLLPVPGEDPDTDGLTSEEEPALGTNPQNPDTDSDSLIDGPQAAESLLRLISELPRHEVSDAPYMLEAWMDGVEQCEICGITLNMGFAEIVNPQEGLSLVVPFVGLHTLAHGGFVYDGSYNDGHLLPLVLRTVLTGDGTAHWVPMGPDTDGDGLLDAEEPFFNLDPAVSDENNSGIPDGRELATTMAARIHELPQGPLMDSIYRVDHPTYGFYTCLVCGEQVNMGFISVANPQEDVSTSVPYYNLHFMDHGSFSTDRNDLYPRVDPCTIGQVLGITRITGIEPAPGLPRFTLRSAPNPFELGAATEILLMVPTLGPVDVAIYDVKGRKVRSIFAGKAPEKIMRFRWDGRDDRGAVSHTGVYFCRVKIGGMTVTRKITLLH